MRLTIIKIYQISISKITSFLFNFIYFVFVIHSKIVVFFFMFVIEEARKKNIFLHNLSGTNFDKEYLFMANKKIFFPCLIL